VFLEQEESDEQKKQAEKEKERQRKIADEEASTNVGTFELVDGTQVSYTLQAHLVALSFGLLI